jgi:SAM-dependent methyltransferase
MIPAIGRLIAVDRNVELGTVFAVTRHFALTAFHCVGDRNSGELEVSRVRCIWDGSANDAVVEDMDRRSDVALLRLTGRLHGNLQPVRLTREVSHHDPFIAPGAPAAVREVSGFAISGAVTWKGGRLEDGTPALQLACRESAAGLPLQGLSGAPVLVGQHLHAVGVIRWNPPRHDQPILAAGAVVFAAPAYAILDRWPMLESTGPDQSISLPTLVTRWIDRGALPDDLAADDVARLLLTHGLGLSESDFTVNDGRVANEYVIEIATGATILLITNDLQVTGTAKSAQEQLDRQLALHDNDTSRRWIGVLTDGIEWRIYRRILAKCHEIHATFAIEKARPNVDDLLAWLESILSTGHELEPTPDEIVAKLGAKSVAHAVDSAELHAIYLQYKDLPSVRVKRALWARLLTTASGVNFVDDDSLFVDHTLLVAMAEVIGHAAVGFKLDDPSLTVAAITSGELFSNAQVGGVIEADFFDWVVEVPSGEVFIKDLGRRLARFSWNHVEHDIMKALYESIIPQTIRHRLGEYYTPDWLADYIVDECVEAPLAQRVLDASCGSGTFLFHAVRHYITAAESSGWSVAETVGGVTEHVFGFDVHPVAVTLARVTYLLAIGAHRLQDDDRPAFNVPVYLADSLRWGEETTLWSDNSLNVPTDLDHQTFVTDASFAAHSVRSLSFPDRLLENGGQFDRLILELAELATKRPRGSDVPSLSATFWRFSVESKDERSLLQRTFTEMCKLHDEERDHIWGYYVRNVARPAWLKRPENRVDVLVGNPPWLAYRYMTQPQKKTFRSMSTERNLWAGTSRATSMDLSSLFVVRCIELYLRPGGRFGYVMPLGTQNLELYSGFRTGRYPGPAESVSVRFDRRWDLHQIKPAFFTQSVGVVFGRRATDGEDSSALNAAPAEVWSGKFGTKVASRTAAAAAISRVLAETTPDRTRSPYAPRFRQGAALVPRLFFLVKLDRAGPLGFGAGRQAVQSERSAFEKKPWKNLQPLRGNVERKFIRPAYLGDSILPFRCLEPHRAIIPWNTELLGGREDQLHLHPGLAKWWREADSLWKCNRSTETLSLSQQLDYRRKLTHQFPIQQYRVVYSKSGMYLAAATLLDMDAIVDQQLYWCSVSTLNEARYLTSILNSTTLTLAVRPLQARGQHNPRDFAKYIFQLPIPLFDESNDMHLNLVGLAEQAELIAANTTLPPKRFEIQRRRVREALVEYGLMASLDAAVKDLVS